MSSNGFDPRRVEYLPLAVLTEDERNPKSHSLETIDKSIGRFGMLDPIVRDERTGHIVSGHGRFRVLSDMEDRGETPPEGVKLSPDGDWLVPVVVGWSSRSDTEAAAALVALNRTTELGGWVDDALLDILDDLSEFEGGLEGVGFDDTELYVLKRKLDQVAKDTPENHLESLEQSFSGDGEVDVDGWEFTHTCPSCGFQFNE